jgi:glyoxylase-like metal-dependent hydrolase (beta-lactamase superfamily II)
MKVSKDIFRKISCQTGGSVRPVRLEQLRPGLHRWTAVHPDADPNPKPGSPADWGPEVGSVAYEAEDALVLVDPLVPHDGWDELDELVERHGQRVTVITTLSFHRRSRPAVVERYGASTSRAKETLPAGVETIAIRGAGETMVWLPGPRALIPGDRLLGDDAGGLRLCPESWLRYLPSGMTRAQLAEELRPLLDLPIELVLASHGEPVLAGAREALSRAIESP